MALTFCQLSPASSAGSGHEWRQATKATAMTTDNAWTRDMGPPCRDISRKQPAHGATICHTSAERMAVEWAAGSRGRRVHDGPGIFEQAVSGTAGARKKR